jgi:lipid A ethanolaminephosphotransferase
MQLFSKKLSEVNLVLLVAAFLTLTGNFTFLEKTLQIYPLSENWLFVGSLFLFLFTFLSALLIVLCFRWSLKPILILLLLISAVLTYSTNNFGVVFDHNMITNTFETDTSEFSDLVSIKSLIYFCLLGLIPSTYVWKIQLVKSSIKTQLWQRVKMLLALIVVFVIVVLSFSKHYTSFARENRDLRLYITPTYLFVLFSKVY